MRELISLLASPLPVLYILLIITLMFRLFGKRKAAGVLLFLSVLWFIAITTRPIPHLLVNNLEKQYRQLSDEQIREIPDSVNIIVLGAGHTDDADLAPNNQLNWHAMMRLSEGIRLQKQLPGSKLILSGMGYRTSLSGALIMYRTALMLGMDSASLELSDLPMTTNSEADQYLSKFGKERKLVLVTSAIHMPRSVMLFKSKGIDVIPAPSDFLIRHPSQPYRYRLVPWSDNIGWLEQAIHEYGGIMWFRAGGR